MKNNRIVKTLALLLALCLTLSACGPAAIVEVPVQQQSAQVQSSQVTNLANTAQSSAAPEKGTYNEGVALVKYDKAITDNMLVQLNCRSAEPLYDGSAWYLLQLAEDADTVQTVEYLRQLGCFDAVDYDYVMATTAVTGAIVASGECGDNATWTLDEAGLLTISGTGMIYNYEANGGTNVAPWCDLRDNIYTVIIEDGVSGIGSYAFAYCKAVTSVTIPDSVSVIRNAAFFMCDSLTNISVPNDVTRIYEYTFAFCHNLSKISIPDGVTSIDLCAFHNCSQLTDIVIPNKTVSIGGAAFGACISLTNVTIGSGVTNIDNAAFNACSDLTSVTFLGNAPVIVETAFQGDTITAYYPANDPTWTEEVLQNYGGNITWVAYDALPSTEMHPNYDVHGVQDAWEYLEQNGHNPGGSPDVIVAVIDTGVDYNHVDLRNNIWVNPAEIPGNGIDDDGNGYVDDVRGWDCVGDDNDPMDDHGHGTHVAGIIAAENNDQGAVGIAFNCKIMVLKAGNSSGYFNNSDIAEAIQYAYMNGASVINMSFGGASISIAVEDALQEAYNSCVLVAAAGNMSACTLPACIKHKLGVPFFPASLPYVIGVMSVDNTGAFVSGFSNFNHPDYNVFRYNVYASGEAVFSCWPNNKYTQLSGTSMASPVVAGIAALLRSAYPDREAYSSKFIQSQIVNTGTIHPLNLQKQDSNGGQDLECAVLDMVAALTTSPKPSIYAMNAYVDDSESISSANNGNGIIDAGETVHMYCSFFNKGGVASNVQVSIDTIRNNDPSLTDPYFTFVNTTMKLSDIGTYSERESGDQYFEIIVDPNCPNEYIAVFNFRLTYMNGMDDQDEETYRSEGGAAFIVSNGCQIGGVIEEDTVFAADKLYIVGEDLIIPEGITVTFEPGCQIQFYDGRDYYNSPRIINYGVLIFSGTEDSMVRLFPSETYDTFVCTIENYGVICANYLDAMNAWFAQWSKNAIIEVNDSKLRQQVAVINGVYTYSVLEIHSGLVRAPMITKIVEGQNFSVRSSYVEHKSRDSHCYTSVSAFENCLILIDRKPNTCLTSIDTSYSNNIIYSAIIDKMYDNSNTIELEHAENNLFINDMNGIDSLLTLLFSNPTQASGNAFSKDYKQYASQVIQGYYDSTGHPIIDVYGSLADASLLWPHVVQVEIFDKDGNPITCVGREEIKVRVTFNRPMDTTKDTFLTFGTIEPYADYRIDGKYISSTVWEGTYTLKAQIENGQNFLKVNNACAAEDQTKVVFGEYQLHEFTIDTTAAMAMNLQAFPTYEGILLNFAQDDYDTLLGYNIYRSDEKDGYYTKLNSTVLLPTENSFLDENAEPGKTYWYTYTVVLSDFTESKPAGRVSCTGYDTILPNLYHTPVNQGYAQNNLVISCSASDNIAIDKVTLYYRSVGDTTWKSLNMSKQNDKYSATIFGSDVTLAGIEYYIVASDGFNTMNRGSADAPYTVLIKDAVTLSHLGDVDGDNTITTLDALMIIQAINGDLLLSDDAFQRADLNKNGKLDSVEALRILQYLNGNVNSLEM